MIEEETLTKEDKQKLRDNPRTCDRDWETIKYSHYE